MDRNYPRPKADKRWLGLIVLMNKKFISKEGFGSCIIRNILEKNPDQLIAIAQSVNLLKMAGVALK